MFMKIAFILKQHQNWSKNVLTSSLFSFMTTIPDYKLQPENMEKAKLYWDSQTIPEILEQADDLYVDEQYFQIYELLNRLKFRDNVEAQWRICRVIFKMSHDSSISETMRRVMIEEAHDLISTAVHLDENNAEVHKWKAIMTDLKHGLDGTSARVKSLETVKHHLIRASELNPSDVSVLYMLGRWCFQMSNFSWFQRAISAILFGVPPASSYQEAFNYFQRAEQIKPRFYLPNLYMLGQTSYYLNQYFLARYYSHIAASLPVRSKYEKQCALKAQALAKKLQEFDVGKNALLYEMEWQTN